MKSVPAITFEYRPSRVVGWAVAFVLILGCLSLWLTAVDRLFVVALSLVVLLAGVLELRNRSRHAGVRFTWPSDGPWEVTRMGLEPVSAHLVSHRALMSIVVIRLRTGTSGVIPLVLTPDNLAPHHRRHMRIRLAQAPSITEQAGVSPV